MSAHTTGPWHIDGSDVFAKDDSLVVDCSIAIARPDLEICANARLIAAAPDLLQALDDLLLCIEVDALMPESVSFMRQARAAIAKATGAESKEAA